jgi:hypothetical protein
MSGNSKRQDYLFYEFHELDAAEVVDLERREEELVTEDSPIRYCLPG